MVVTTMSPEKAEEFRGELCCKTAGELLAASAECTATRLEYVHRMRRRGLTPEEEVELSNVEELQELINDAKDALVCMREELPWAISSQIST